MIICFDCSKPVAEKDRVTLNETKKDWSAWRTICKSCARLRRKKERDRKYGRGCPELEKLFRL